MTKGQISAIGREVHVPKMRCMERFPVLGNKIQVERRMLEPAKFK